MIISRQALVRFNFVRSKARLGSAYRIISEPSVETGLTRLGSFKTIFLKQFHINHAPPSVELIFEKTIKPYSPTPQHLQKYKFSLIDQLITDQYMPIALFYSKKSISSSNNNYNNISQMSLHLQESLSKLLTIYYPLGGRLVGDNISVSCNDKGATFKEVRIKCSMSEIFKKPHSFVENSVFPPGLPYNDSPGEGSLLVAQVSHFECGGIAISLCMSHKVIDGVGRFNLLNDWAKIFRGCDLQTIGRPIFDGALLFPPLEDSGNQTPREYETKKQPRIPMRIMFTAEKIKKLKKMIAEDQESAVNNPTRTEVVAAFLTKYNLIASTFKPIVLFMMVNLRTQLNPPLEGSWVGNFVSYISISITKEQDLNLAKLVSKIRSEKIKLSKRFKGLKREQLIDAAYEDRKRFAEIAKKGFEFYSVTTACNVPYYGIDFKWGKPERVTLVALPSKNYFNLLDDYNGGGVEVIASIDEKVLPILEKDEEFLTFASFDQE